MGASFTSFPLAIEWNKLTPKTTHEYEAVIEDKTYL